MRITQDGREFTISYPDNAPRRTTLTLPPPYPNGRIKVEATNFVIDIDPLGAVLEVGQQAWIVTNPDDWQVGFGDKVDVPPVVEPEREGGGDVGVNIKTDGTFLLAGYSIGELKRIALESAVIEAAIALREADKNYGPRVTVETATRVDDAERVLTIAVDALIAEREGHG